MLEEKTPGGMQVGKLRGGCLAGGKGHGTVSAQPWGGLPRGAQSAQEPTRTWAEPRSPFMWAGVEGALLGQTQVASTVDAMLSHRTHLRPSASHGA